MRGGQWVLGSSPSPSNAMAWLCNDMQTCVRRLPVSVFGLISVLERLELPQKLILNALKTGDGHCLVSVCP